MVGKPEWLPGKERGDNQRFVVISLERGRIGTQTLCEQLYCGLGDMENRIKGKHPTLEFYRQMQL